MTNGVKTRLLTPYVMMCKICKKKCMLRSSEEKPSGAQRGSARLRAARETGQEASERLRLAQRAAKRQRAAQRGSERLRGAERCADGPRAAPRGSDRVRAALSSFGKLRVAQAGPERPRAAQRGRETKNLEFCQVYIMTNGVKPRVLTPYVIICKNYTKYFVQFIYDDIWCQNSRFDIICHDMWLAKNCFFTKKQKLWNFAGYI